MKYFKNILLLFLLFIPISLYAEDLIEEINGEYFTIYSQGDIDLLDIAYKIKLQTNFYLHKDDNSQIFRGGSPKEVLAENIDLLFKEVADILDMHLYSYHGDIKIFSDQKDLEVEFDNIFNGELDVNAFYYNDNNTIYLAADSINVELLSQRIADAIVSHYFVVMPPDKVRDVLSEHVKYSIGNKLKRE